MLTIRLNKDKQTDYNGARSLDAMQTFALKSVETCVKERYSRP